LTGLHKEFGDNVAVRHIDLIVPRGSFFGLVGPNAPVRH
jgi:ABC-2 type transport system ATP-binding protein